MSTYLASDFDDNELRTLEIIERTMSVISLVSTLFVVVTFLSYQRFRKPINRLIFFASFGNILCNVGTLISVSGVEKGQGSPLCSFQGFLIQLTMMADSLWTFCMALNVYLTFFRSYTQHNLSKLEKWYFVGCYGVPLVPAIIFLLMDATAHKRIYGPATMWCWISIDWDWMRIAFFYGPIWIVIAATFFIYIRTGKAIFEQRNALREFSRQHSVPLPPMENPFTSVNFEGIRKVTEMEVEIREASDDLPSGKSHSDCPSRSSFASTRKLSANGIHGTELQRVKSQSHIHDQDQSTKCTTTVSGGSAMVANQPGEEDYGLSKVTSGSGRAPKTTIDANRAAWGYTKVALLMFAALLVVWVPSTVNRVYALCMPNKPIFSLNAIAAAVLPLQGFWNSVIYIATSWRLCTHLWHEKIKCWGQRPHRVVESEHRHHFPHINFASHRPHFHDLYHNHRRNHERALSNDALQSDLDLDVDVDAEHMTIQQAPRAHAKAPSAVAFAPSGANHAGTRPRQSSNDSTVGLTLRHAG